MGSGRPVLCSDVMPMPEFGGEGLQYFSPHDQSSIHGALMALLSDTVLAARVGRAAAERSTHYDWARTAAQTWDHIIALAGGTPPAQAPSRART